VTWKDVWPVNVKGCVLPELASATEPGYWKRMTMKQKMILYMCLSDGEICKLCYVCKTILSVVIGLSKV